MSARILFLFKLAIGFILFCANSLTTADGSLSRRRRNIIKVDIEEVRVPPNIEGSENEIIGLLCFIEVDVACEVAKVENSFEWLYRGITQRNVFSYEAPLNNSSCQIELFLRSPDRLGEYVCFAAVNGTRQTTSITLSNISTSTETVNTPTDSTENNNGVDPVTASSSMQTPFNTASSPDIVFVGSTSPETTNPTINVTIYPPSQATTSFSEVGLAVGVSILCVLLVSGVSAITVLTLYLVLCKGKGRQKPVPANPLTECRVFTETIDSNRYTDQFKSGVNDISKPATIKSSVFQPLPPSLETYFSSHNENESELYVYVETAMLEEIARGTDGRDSDSPNDAMKENTSISQVSEDGYVEVTSTVDLQNWCMEDDSASQLGSLKNTTEKHGYMVPRISVTEIEDPVDYEIPMTPNPGYTRGLKVNRQLSAESTYQTMEPECKVINEQV